LRRTLVIALLSSLLFLSVATLAQEEPFGESGESVAPLDIEEHEAEEENVTAWKALNFGLLVVALVWLLRKPAKQYFAGRTSEIQKDILEATKAREEAEARAAEMERRLTDLEKEIQELRASARSEMEAEDERLRTETELALAKLRSRSEQEISATARAAGQELRAEAARLALELARGKVRQKMTPDVSSRLLHSFVDQLDEKAGRTA